MASETHVHIPRYGGAGVAFAGAEVDDAKLSIGGVVLGLIVGGLFHVGTPAFLGFPIGGFILNKLYIEWKAGKLPGQIRATLFHMGWGGYSSAFPTQDMVFVGDAQAGSHDSVDLVSDLMTRLEAHAELEAAARAGLALAHLEH